jgi:hypothetical protein
MKTYFIIVDHVGNKEAWITTHPTRYRKDTKRYGVWGPYNLAAARFTLWGC